MAERSRDFRSYLQEELVLRCQRNPAYSLRSFAKAVDLSPSFLSKLLNGQRRITNAVFQKLSAHLGLDEGVAATFRSSDTPTADVALRDLQLENFKVISDWYHYAILELTKVAKFQSTPDWIAAKLGISVTQAKAAIARLQRLELLEERRGRLRATSSGNTTTRNEFTDMAFKKMQDELLNLATRSLWNEPLSQRDHTSICMAIHPSDLPEVKRRLTHARRELCQFLERPQTKKPTQVYNLSLAFFPLSKESK